MTLKSLNTETCLIQTKNCMFLPNHSTEAHLRILVSCVILLYVYFPCCDVYYNFRIKKRCSVGIYLQLFVVGSCLIYMYVICVRIVVSITYCVVFLFCFSSSSVPCVASFSGLSIFDCPFIY